VIGNMFLFKKLLINIAVVIFYFWVTVIPAYSDGFAFDWLPFTARKNFEADTFYGSILPKEILFPREARNNFDDIDYLWLDNSAASKISPAAESRKSAFSNIRVTISSVNSFMMSPDESGSRGKDGMISKLAQALPALLQNPKQETVVQTLKLFEPQVNLGFEF
jgi:hypothetical protein